MYMYIDIQIQMFYLPLRIKILKKSLGIIILANFFLDMVTINYFKFNNNNNNKK